MPGRNHEPRLAPFVCAARFSASLIDKMHTTWNAARELEPK